MDRLGPQLVFVIVEVADQTIAFFEGGTDADPTDGGWTIVHRKARLYVDRDEAECVVNDIIADHDAWLRSRLSDPELEHHLRDDALSELQKPPEKRRSSPWIEEVRGVASFQARPDTW